MEVNAKLLTLVNFLDCQKNMSLSKYLSAFCINLVAMTLIDILLIGQPIQWGMNIFAAIFGIIGAKIIYELVKN